MKSQRSILSQSSVNDLAYGPEWIGFFKDSITALNRQVKRDPTQVEECMTLLEWVKHLHKSLKRRGCCPELQIAAFHPRKIDMEALRSKLKKALDQITAE